MTLFKSLFDNYQPEKKFSGTWKKLKKEYQISMLIEKVQTGFKQNPSISSISQMTIVSVCNTDMIFGLPMSYE